MANATALINTSLPPWDNIYSFQTWSFSHTLCLISLKAFLCDETIKDGRPRNVSCSLFISPPHKFEIFFSILNWELWLKIIKFFVKLITSPKKTLYSFKILWTYGFSSSTVVLQNHTIISRKEVVDCGGTLPNFYTTNFFFLFYLI